MDSSSAAAGGTPPGRHNAQSRSRNLSDSRSKGLAESPPQWKLAMPRARDRQQDKSGCGIGRANVKAGEAAAPPVVCSTLQAHSSRQGRRGTLAQWPDARRHSRDARASSGNGTKTHMHRGLTPFTEDKILSCPATARSRCGSTESNGSKEPERATSSAADGVHPPLYD